MPEGSSRMRGAWNDGEAEAAVVRYARDGVGRDLALRVYSTRLLRRARSSCYTAAAIPR
jgi:hypothetical protein